MGVIIYGSKYGTSKRYAEELVRRTGFELREFSNTGDKQPEEKLTADMKALVETYNRKVDYVDFGNLDQIVRDAQSA